MDSLTATKRLSPMRMTSQKTGQSVARYCMMNTSLPKLGQLQRFSSLSRISRPFPSRRISITHSSPCKVQYSTSSSSIPEAMETIKQTVAQNLGVSGSHTLVPEHQQFDLDQVPDLSGKVAVVTGGSEGIGYGCTHTLLKHGIKKLFILSVSKDVIDGSINAIKEEMGEETAKKVIWLQCDLADWKAVKQTADKIVSNTDRLDILINNAARGIMTYQLTDYGVDRHVSLHFPSAPVRRSHMLISTKRWP